MPSVLEMCDLAGHITFHCDFPDCGYSSRSKTDFESHITTHLEQRITPNDCPCKLAWVWQKGMTDPQKAYRRFNYPQVGRLKEATFPISGGSNTVSSRAESPTSDREGITSSAWTTSDAADFSTELGTWAMYPSIGVHTHSTIHGLSTPTHD
ncbi:hypothetical protein FA13DRAFT_1908406 [Coprinellus micaceus]|uniref:C2H2-type domain-containing protein n=1 Tax=Coprinellus micaceus TaxID=71717 RepID=A0A4Y7SRI9_COPMI|nr:hypothetical protein FA13DRAFT_1908406 [Coprinellus micaceus]